jgi:energy-coupling factor transport system permease protein
MRPPVVVVHGVFTKDLLETELAAIKEAQLVRGVKPARNRFAEQLGLQKRYAQALLVSGLRRVENVSIAMDSRAFGAMPKRTFVDDFSWTIGGVVLMSTWVALLLGLLAFRIAR